MRVLLAILALFLSISAADARRVRQVQPQFPDFTMTSWQTTGGFGEFFQRPTQASPLRQAISRSGRTIQMLAHPSGCPRRAFCGCGAAVAIFGTPRRDLWLAANWLRFPRTSPSSGMVAARRGHVFVLRQHVGGNVWVVEDYNSGKGASRIHERSIAGYAIVNPRA